MGPLEERGTWEYPADQAPRVTLAFQGSREAKGRRVQRESKDLKAGQEMPVCQGSREVEESEALLESRVEKAV